MTQTLTTGKPYSLYFHFPFCRKKCPYCHFYVVPDDLKSQERLLAAFISQLEQSLPAISDGRLVSVYFGGGTPSLIAPSLLEKLTHWIQTKLSCDFSTIEVTLEANPEEFSPEKIRAFKEIGINRVSIGVQSFDDKLLSVLGRTHDSHAACRAVEESFAAGIKQISIDLMYELPHQTQSSWQETLNYATSLPITHLSLYNLTFEPRTIFFKNRQSLEMHVPSSSENTKFLEMATSHFASKGLEQYEISAFARDGNISQHNVGYWTARPFLGFGPSAYSFWGGERFMQVAHVKKYCEAAEAGLSTISEFDSLDPQARRREIFIVNLRLFEGVEIESFEQAHGVLEADFKEELLNLEEEKLLQFREGKWLLSKRGRLFYDTVASRLV